MTNALPPTPQPVSATLDCPSCSHVITYYDVTGSWFYGCPNCHTYFKYENEDPPEILMRFPEKALPGILPIGAEGYLGGQLLRVVGYMHRQEKGTNYDWREYVLLLPNGTYTQLAEYEGHWTYIWPIKGNFVEYSKGIRAFYVDANERQYRLYNRYKADVLMAIGEFDWDVLDEEKLNVSEYINPPYLLVGERNPKGISEWFAGEHKSSEQIATAFGLKTTDLPVKVGTGAVEPPYSSEKWQAVLSFTAIALAMLLACQLLFMAMKPRTVVLNTAYTALREPGTVANQFKPVITKSFQIEGPAAVEIDLSAEIDNQWVELPVSLVNEQTGQSYEFTKVIEYYHGTDGGENWTEGSKTDEAELSRIPTGPYHLNLYPISEAAGEVRGSVKVTQNPMMIGNLLILALLLLIYPTYLLIKRATMEHSRWQNSDYADEEP